MFIAVLVVFGLILFISVINGAPYLPTRLKYIDKALDLMKLNKNDLVVDIGCGDGRVLVRACKRGYRAVGYEINPLLWLVAFVRTLRFRGRAKVVLGNMWSHKLPDETKGVFLFLLPRLMQDMSEKLNKELSGAIVVSYAFEFELEAYDQSGPLLAYRFD